MEYSIIHLKGMEFYAFHGLYPEETQLGQKFIIDVDLYLNANSYAADSLDASVNYAEVYSLVQKTVTGNTYKFIEKLAEEIAQSILRDFACQRVNVEVHKPNAPVQGIIRDISVEIHREKQR